MAFLPGQQPQQPAQPQQPQQPSQPMQMPQPQPQAQQAAQNGDQQVTLAQAPLPKKARGLLGELLGQMVEYAIGARQELETNLDYYDALYEMRVKERDWPWEDCSNFVVPFVPAQLDSLAARLTGVVFQPRFFLVNGNTEQAVMSQHQVERYYNAELSRHDWTEDFYQWLHLALRDGTSIMEILWRKDIRTMTFNVQVPETDALGQPIMGDDGQPTFRTEQQEHSIAVYDDVELTPIELRDFMLLPSWQTDLQARGAGCARMKLMSEAELRSMVKNTDNPKGVLFEDAVDEELATLSPGESDLNQSHQSLVDFTANFQIDITEDISDDLTEAWDTKPKIARSRGPMRVWRIHTDALDMDGDGVPEENVFWIREQSRRLLGFKRYDYLHMKRPFVALTPIPRPGRFYGKSVCELLRTVQEELNAIHNQRNDQISLRLSPPMYRMRTADVSDQDMRWGPDAEWLVDSPNDVGIIEMPDVPLSSWQEEQFLTNYGYQIIGQSASTLGAMSSSRRTAKEVMAASAASNVRADLMAARIRTAAREVFWQIHHLKLQFGPDQLEVTDNVNGQPQRLQIPKQILALDYDLGIAGQGGPLDKQGRQQDMMLVYSMLTQNPLVAQNPMHLYAVTRMVLEAIGVPDIQALIGTPEELQKQLQQQMQKAQAQQKMQQQLDLMRAQHGLESPKPAVTGARPHPHGGHGRAPISQAIQSLGGMSELRAA